MEAKSTKDVVCSICGQLIDPKPLDPDDKVDYDHVPPRQFYLKEIRKAHNLNLWTTPTHRRCNRAYREDEEYFFHAAYPLIQKSNHGMSRAFHRELMRRTHEPQTPRMIRRLLKEFRTVTENGIILPPPVVQLSLDANRMKRVAIKVAQGLFYKDENRHISFANCKDLHFCESEAEAPEAYQLSWRCTQVDTVLPSVFSYRRFDFDNKHLFSMLFWEAFMFCVGFESPEMACVPAA